MNLLTMSEITYVYAITTRFCGYTSRKIYLLHTALIRDVNYCNVNDYFIMTNWICYKVNMKLYMKTLCGCARWCCDIIGDFSTAWIKYKALMVYKFSYYTDSLLVLIEAFLIINW